MYDIETVSALSNGIVVVASQSRPAQRFVRWGGGNRQTPRLKWASSEFNLGLPEEDKYVLDGPATPDEVWQVVNGKTIYSVTDLRGVKHWFESEDKAVAFVYEDMTGEVAPPPPAPPPPPEPTPPPPPPPPAKSRRKPGKAVVELANARGVDLDVIVGTGAGGAVKVADVYAHLGEKPPRKGAKVA